MKVQVWRSGGLLGRRIEWDVVVDEQPDPERWYVLLAELPWHEHPVENTMPDRYTYEIHCEPHEAVIPEQQLVGPWRELVDRVREASQPSRPAPEPQPAPSPQPKPEPEPEPEIECD
ncbi:protealysin inhibitor emfourin [Salinibacterium sp. SWN248]|uniref:protealysin inhibitor emfourin n=1 Tax=Salinibacterium sp. SWN248 TaxID=2792056 RepID=UPI001E5D05BF|nr:protealysin inhibitor emfourin [Salinibacterium sp. SWN248]